MSRQDTIISIMNCMIEVTNKPFVTCAELLRTIDAKCGMAWRDIFDIHGAAYFHKYPEIRDDVLERVISNSGWPRTATREHKESHIKARYEKVKTSYQDKFKSVFELKKIKINSGVYETYSPIISHTSVVDHLLFTVDGNGFHEYANTPLKDLFNRFCEFTPGLGDPLGALLHSLEILPENYCIHVTHTPHYRGWAVLLYRKAKHHKPENNSIEVLELIDRLTGSITFNDVFKIKDADGVEFRPEAFDAMGQLMTVSYAHDSVTKLRSFIKCIEHEDNYNDFLSLVGLSKVTYKNRLAQLYLLRSPNDDLKRHYYAKDATPELIHAAIDVLEARYQNFINSKKFNRNSRREND